MLIFLIITALTIAGLAIMFALQNAEPVLVDFLFWSFEGSLALILLLTFIMGVISTLLMLLYWMIRKGMLKYRKKKWEEPDHETQ